MNELLSLPGNKILHTIDAFAARFGGTIVFVAGLFGLYLSRQYSFLLFHTLAELFSIVVASTIFVLAWKSQRFLDNGYLLFIGVSYLFVGGIDLIHTLAYKGMGVFEPDSTNLPTQLWIAARYLQAFSWLAAPLFLFRRINVHLIVAGFALVSSLLMMSIFYWQIFPDSYIDGTGLTQFKKISEYIISILLLGSAFLVLKNRDEFHPSVLRWLVLSIFSGVASELAFTEYISVYGNANMVGHLLKIVSFFFVYKAIIETGFDRPYDLLFRKLKQSEDALRQSESRLRRLVDSNIIGVIFTDTQGAINGANDAFLSMTGYSRSELEEGVSWKNITPPEYFKRDQTAIIEALTRDSGACSPYEKEFIGKDGRKIPVLVGFALLQGSATEFIGFILDLTERKKAEEALQRIEWLLTKSIRSEENLRIESLSAEMPYGDLADHNTSRYLLDMVGRDVLNDIVADFLDLLETSAAVYEKNGDYVLWTHSSAWCGYLNLASRQLCQTEDNVEAIQNGQWLCHQSCWNSAARKSIHTGQPVDIECVGGIGVYAVPILANGEVVGSLCAGYGDPPKDSASIEAIAERFSSPVEEIAYAANAYESRPPYLIELAKNRLNVSARLLGAIVERKQAEANMKSYARQLERSNKELKDFAFIASHDLQEPLRKIQAFGERLSSGYSDAIGEEGRIFLDRMTNAAERMQQMINDLLAYSRVTTQGNPFKPVDLNIVMGEVLSDLEVRIESTRGKVTVSNLPIVEADPRQMQQLLQNLLSNALKFHREGVPPEVKVSADIQGGRSSNGKGKVQISVLDNGIGFDEQYLDRIFQPFQRLVGKSRYEGSGIGMAICRKIVERHSGEITASSIPGEGTTFIVTLPLRQMKKE